MGTTDNLGIPYPESSDLVTNGAAAMQALAEAVDDRPATVGVTAAANWISSGTDVRKVGHVVEVNLNVTATATVGGSVTVCTLPAGMRPGAIRYFSGIDSASGAGGVGLKVNADGTVQHVLGRASGAGTLATLTFVAVN